MVIGLYRACRDPESKYNVLWEPEQKCVANKCMCEEIHAHNNGTSYIELHTQNKCTCHESTS